MLDVVWYAGFAAFVAGVLYGSYYPARPIRAQVAAREWRGVLAAFANRCLMAALLVVTLSNAEYRWAVVPFFVGVACGSVAAMSRRERLELRTPRP